MVDFEVPKRFGLRQTIGDTLGIGGIMRGLRTIPVLLDVCRDMEELCPDALLLNYVNPMAMLCWAVAETSPIRTVGLCHSVQHTAAELAADLGVPAEELDYHVAGINHVAFFLRLERDGEDLYPALAQIVEDGRVPDGNRVRYELLRHFGYFVTESSEHFAEYVPWFIKDGREDLIERFNIPLDEYPRRSERQIAEWDALRDRAGGRRQLDGRRAQRRVRRGHHQRLRDRRAVRVQRQRAQPHDGGAADRQPARRLLRRGAVRRGRGRDRAAAGGLAAAPPRRADADQHQRAGADRRGGADRAGATAVHHAAMLDPHTAAELSLEEISRWSRSCSRPTGTGSRRSTAPRSPACSARRAPRGGFLPWHDGRGPARSAPCRTAPSSVRRFL